MPQTKPKLPRGDHKILSAKGKLSKKLKAKHRLLRRNHKVISTDERLSTKPKDNSDEVLSKTNETSSTKRNIPHVEPNSQVILDRPLTKREKILLEKKNNSQHQNNELPLTSKSFKDNTCDLSAMETVNKVHKINKNDTSVGIKTRKRRRPFAHINETQDYSLTPIVLLERLSVEQLKQSILTNEENSESLNDEKDIGDLSTQINENVNPVKRRKKSLYRSFTRRKSHSNSESELITCEKESLNLEKKLVEKLSCKKVLNKDSNVEEINLLENKQSKNKDKLDNSDSKNIARTNKSKNETSVDSYENELDSKGKNQVEKNDNHQASFSQISQKMKICESNQSQNRKTSLRQRNQNTLTSASLNRKSKNESEDAISRNDSKNEKNKHKSTVKKIDDILLNTRTTSKLENKSVNEKDIKGKEKNINSYNNEGKSKSKSSEDKLGTKKSEQESIAIISDTIKSEIESDNADSSEENDVLNIKIFEMDNEISIGEEDLVLSQLRKSMRVESEPFKNNEVVNVKIFQIDKSLDIENCASQTCATESLKDQNEVDVSPTDNELNKDKLKNTEEKKLIESGIKSITKTVEGNEDSEEKTLTDKCKKTDDNTTNKGVEIRNDILKNKVVIKVKIVKIDQPLDINDCFSQEYVSKTSDDKIEGDKITGGLSYVLNNDKLIDTNEKTLNYSPIRRVKKTVKRKTDTGKIRNKNELSKGKPQSTEENNEKSLTETCAKVNNQENTLITKIDLKENKKLEVASDTFINNEIVKIKIFEKDKTMNIKDYLSESFIEKVLNDKIESVKATTDFEFSNDKLKDTKEKVFDSTTKSASTTFNENKEEKLKDFHTKSSVKNIQNKKRKLQTTNSKDLNKRESNSTEETVLADCSSNIISKTGEDKIEAEKSFTSKNKLLINSPEKCVSNIVENKIEVEKNEISNELSKTKSEATKEKVPVISGAKSVSKIVRNKVAAEKTESSNDSTNEKSKAAIEKPLIDSCLTSVSNIVQDKIEAEKIAKSNTLSTDKSKNKEEKTVTNFCVQSISKIVEDKFEVEKDKSSNTLNDEKSKTIPEKTLINSSVNCISTALIDQNPKSNEISQEKLIDNNGEKTAANSSKKKDNISIQNKIETEKTESSSDLSKAQSNVNKKSIIDSCEKSVSKKLEDKIQEEKTPKSNVLSEGKLLGPDKTLTNSSDSKDVRSKTIEDKIESEKVTIDNDLHNKKLNASKEKVIVEPRSNSVSNIVKKKIERVKVKNNNKYSNDKSCTSNDKSLIYSSKKSSSSNKTEKDTIQDKETAKNNDSCVKSATETKEDNTEVKKTIMDNDVHNKKLYNNKEIVTVEPCSKNVDGNVNDKIETEQTSTSNNVSNDKLKNTKEKCLSHSGAKSDSKIIKDKIELETAVSHQELSGNKSKDSEERSIIDSCTKNVSEAVNNKIDQETIICNESCIEKAKEAEKKKLNDSCITSSGVNVIDKIEALKTNSSNELSDKFQNAEERTLPDSSTNNVDAQKNICSQENKEMEVESHEKLPSEENNAITACTLNSVSSVTTPSKNRVKKKKPNKYRRLKKHMIRKRKKKNRVKIISSKVIKSNKSNKSSKMMELLGTICVNKMKDQNKSNCFEDIVQPSKVKYNAVVETVETSTHKLKKIYRDPVTGKFCSRNAERKKILNIVAKKSTFARSEVLNTMGDFIKNKSVPNNSNQVNVCNTITPSKLISHNNKKLLNSPPNSSISSHFKTLDARRNTSSNQTCNSKGKDNSLNHSNTSTQSLENVVQDEITIEEHEIKIEEDPEVVEIIVSDEEPNNINYVTASEIFSGINSKANQNTSQATILPPNKNSLLRTNCINVNNEQNNVFERDEVMGVYGSPEKNLYMQQLSRSRTSLPSQHLHNQDVNFDDNSFNDPVASTSTNSNNAMGISVREAYEKISLDLLGAYEIQSETDHQSYSNGINDLLHISDSGDEQMSEVNVDSDHDVDQSAINHHNYQPLEEGNSQTDHNSSVFYQKPIKKKRKAIDESMHMLLQCPRCYAECLGIQRLQRHYGRCGDPLIFTCTICHLKLKQKRSLAGHYLSYHSDLVDDNTLMDVIDETVRRAFESRIRETASKHFTMPSHVVIFCDKCQSTYPTVPQLHKQSCKRCLQPLSYYCEKCSCRQSLSLRVQIHAQSKCAERPRCPYCGYVSDSPSRLQEHLNRIHANQFSENLLPCRHGCGLSFLLRNSLQRHESHCAKEKDQLCRFCPFKTKHRSVIKVHMQNHMINKEFSSTQAGKNEKRNDEISKQIEAYCQVCRGVFETPVRSGTRCPRCNAGALYRCRKCAASDTVYREIRRHVNHFHVSQRSARGRPSVAHRSCSKCGETFADATALRRHRNSSSGCCRYRCRRCSKSFNSAGTLKRHLVAYCGVEARLRCEHCSFITKNRFSLVRHLQAQHAEVFNGSTVDCATCGVHFNNIYVYDNHIKLCGRSADHAEVELL